MLTDAEVAIAAALAGSVVVRARYGKTLERFDKSGVDFATDADIATEKAILQVLQLERPTDAFIGEELGASGDPSSDRTWLIDPICGTLNFSAQTPLMVVNVALRTTTGIRVAASADPISGEVFWTQGDGVYILRGGVSQTSEPSPSSRLVEVNLTNQLIKESNFQAIQFLSDPSFMASFQPRVLSSTLPLIWAAVGRRAAYVSGGHLRDSVHFASGIALCQAAGCVVTGLLGQPIHTGIGGLLVAADEETHSRLINIIASHIS